MPATLQAPANAGAMRLQSRQTNDGSPLSPRNIDSQKLVALVAAHVTAAESYRPGRASVGRGAQRVEEYEGPPITVELVRRVRRGKRGGPHAHRFTDPVTGYTFSQKRIENAKRALNWKEPQQPRPDAWGEEQLRRDFEAEYPTLIAQAISAAHRHCMSPDLGRDAVHTAYLSLAQQAPYRPRPSDPGVYLWIVVRRKLLHFIQYSTVRERNEHRIEADTARTYDIHHRIDTCEALERARAILSHEQRRIVFLSVMLGMTMKEIREHEGVTFRTIRYWLRSALQRLRGDAEFCRWLRGSVDPGVCA